jgi:hypothetical protein
MKIHLVETTPNDVDNFSIVNGKHYLISYHYDKNHKLTELTHKKNKDAEILLDSGAFSAWNTNKTVDINEYMKFVKQYSDDYIGYFNMDVVFDGEKSKENYDLMRDNGFNPIPVFHYGSDFDILRHYSKYSDYIALSGFVKYSSNPRLMSNWSKKCLEILPKDKKIHLLGCTSPTILLRFAHRLESVDSTAVTRHQSYHGALSYSGMIKKTKGIPTKLTPEQVNTLQQYSAYRMIQMEKQINDQIKENNIGQV